MGRGNKEDDLRGSFHLATVAWWVTSSILQKNYLKTKACHQEFECTLSKMVPNRPWLILIFIHVILFISTKITSKCWRTSKLNPGPFLTFFFSLFKLYIASPITENMICMLMDSKYVALCPTSPGRPDFHTPLSHFHLIAGLQFNFTVPNQKAWTTDTMPTKAVLFKYSSCQ